MLSLAIDMDEVIADPAAKMIDWYERDFGRRITEKELEGKFLRECVPPEHAGVFAQYLNTPGFFRDLRVMEDAQEVIAELNKKYKVFIVSAAMEFPNSLKDKFDWLQEHFPFLGWRQLYLCGDKSLVQPDIFIDDLTRNFTNFRGKAYLFTAHHNVFLNGYERLYNWKDAAEKLL